MTRVQPYAPNPPRWLFAELSFFVKDQPLRAVKMHGHLPSSRSSPRNLHRTPILPPDAFRHPWPLMSVPPLVEGRLAIGALSVPPGRGRRGSAEARSRRASSEYGLLFATRVSGRFLPSLGEDLCPEPVSRPGERQTKWATRFAEALLRRTTRNLAPEEETDGQVTRQWSGAVVRR